MVNAIKHFKVDDACFGLISADYISLLKELPDCSVSFVRKLANQVAHVLDMASVSMSGLKV